MIVAKLELWPNGVSTEAQHLGTLKISNDATGSEEIGNYQCVILKGKRYSNRGGVWRQCRVEGFPRKSANAGPWDLVRAALNRALGRRWQP